MENNKQKTTIVLFSGDLDKAIAAFIIANGAAAFDHEVTIFTTFWGLNVLRKDQQVPVKKGLLEKGFGWMMPRGPEKLSLSNMNMMGMGPKMIKHVMKKHNALSLPQLIEMAQEQGVKLVACTMTMDLLGIQQEELIDGADLAGVAAYLGDASEAKVNLFI
jgi:peroxiredoxin family protein